MTTSTYISDLLYRYECVILPGFGAFLTQNLPARIDGEKLYPSTKTISFNRHLQTNDGLLANYIASVENCRYEVALYQLRHFSNQTLEKLNKGESVSFKNIGKFIRNSEGKIQFAPVVNQNFSTATFGLTPVLVETIERTSATIEKPIEREAVLLHQKSRKPKTYLKYAAVAVIGLFVAGYGGLNIYENRIEQQNIVERQKASELIESRIQEATFVIENPLPAINLNLSKHQGSFHIVAGAFREESNAEKKIDELRHKGYSPRTIMSRYGLHQILYQSFDNRKEALQVLRKIRETENKSAWLLIQEID